MCLFLLHQDHLHSTLRLWEICISNVFLSCWIPKNPASSGLPSCTYLRAQRGCWNTDRDFWVRKSHQVCLLPSTCHQTRVGVCFLFFFFSNRTSSRHLIFPDQWQSGSCFLFPDALSVVAFFQSASRCCYLFLWFPAHCLLSWTPASSLSWPPPTRKMPKVHSDYTHSQGLFCASAECAHIWRWKEKKVNTRNAPTIPGKSSQLIARCCWSLADSCISLCREKKCSLWP